MQRQAAREAALGLAAVAADPANKENDGGERAAALREDLYRHVLNSNILGSVKVIAPWSAAL
jgi:hypothetical protein